MGVDDVGPAVIDESELGIYLSKKRKRHIPLVFQLQVTRL
jgi:hypothetical protein